MLLKKYAPFWLEDYAYMKFGTSLTMQKIKRVKKMPIEGWTRPRIPEV